MPRNILRDPSYGSGQGFCYDVDRSLFRSELADGPLVVALDSNIVIDTMAHGIAILDGGPYPDSVSGAQQVELSAWGEILQLWLMRDVRLVALPGMRDDHRMPLTSAQTAEKNRQLRAVEDALAFQLDDWGAESDRFASNITNISPTTEASVRKKLSHLDAGLLLEAALCGVDVFLTQDRALLNRMRAAELHGLPNILKPTELADRLESIGLLRSKTEHALLFAGHLQHRACSYREGMPMGDTGRWVTLFDAIFQGQ